MLLQYLGLTVSISNGFGLFQQLNYNLSLHFTPGLQSAYYNDRFCKAKLFDVCADFNKVILKIRARVISRGLIIILR